MRRSLRLARAVLFILGAISLPSEAVAAKCDDFSLSTTSTPKAGTVKADQGPRLYFQRVEDGCPGGDTCKAKAYLVPGDKVVLDDTGKAWLCVYFQGPKRGTFGWLPRTALKIDNPPAATRKQDWIGRWELADNSIVIDERKDGKLHFKGVAINYSEFGLSKFEFDKSIKGNQVIDRSAGGQCIVTLRLINGLILAETTSYCVGVATFDGIYRRTTLTTAPKDEG
jgi:hypothetical protein